MKLTKDQIDATVLWARMLMSIDDVPLQTNRANVERMLAVMVALDDENKRLRAERAEMVALLDGNGDRPCPLSMNFSSMRCQWENPCWEHRRRALLAKLKASP